MSAVQNDFSKGSVVKNIVNLALPMTLAQLVNVLYNVVDRVYIGHMPQNATESLTGLGLCLPVISIVIAFANLFGMGGAPLCSIERGRGNEEEAERIMGNSFTLLVASGIILTAIGLIFKRPLLYLFGASDITYPYADAYMTIYLLGSVFVMIGLGMNAFVNSQGFARIGMLTVLLGAVANLILDPIFIFAFHMGVQGAALATIISQFMSAVWVFRFLTGEQAILRLRKSTLRLEKRRVKKIVSMGVSTFMAGFTNSLVSIVCNSTLQGWGGYGGLLDPDFYFPGVFYPYFQSGAGFGGGGGSVDPGVLFRLLLYVSAVCGSGQLCRSWKGPAGHLLFHFPEGYYCGSVNASASLCGRAGIYGRLPRGAGVQLDRRRRMLRNDALHDMAGVKWKEA